MKRKDLPLFIVLIVLVFFWPSIDRHLIRPFFPRSSEPAETGGAERPARPNEGRPQKPSFPPPPSPQQEFQPAPEQSSVKQRTDEQHVILRNSEAEFTFSNQGAGVLSIRLFNYPKTLDPDSGPVVLDFSESPGLAYEGLPDFGVAQSFTVESSRRQVVFRRRASSGLELTRTCSLSETGFLLRVEDVFVNRGSETADLPPHWLHSGPMRTLPGESTMRGVAHLGVDTLSPGEKVRHWGRRIPKLFKSEDKASASEEPTRFLDVPLTGKSGTEAMDWAAVKNKYFVQILRPEFGAQAVRLLSRRDVENPNKTPDDVAVALRFEGINLAPGQSNTVRVVHYYTGPKKLGELTRLGYHQISIMEFGMWSPVSRVLLRLLNFFHAGIKNYGVAIILLTILIRIIFWPITHKSTQSMRRMQEIQPLVKEMREKYKDNPQRQQRELMALYKEHKVNPLGGCLPMLIQIPVFIALFVVLRSAIELRFASFLWVRDLSEPENLLAGQLPFGLSLNILPLIMTAVQYWQQKLTPTSGEPSQQKMMAFMPFIMLIFFYNFASGLVLYWTTNQFLMVLQQLLHRQRKKASAA